MLRLDLAWHDACHHVHVPTYVHWEVITTLLLISVYGSDHPHIGNSASILISTIGLDKFCNLFFANSASCTFVMLSLWQTLSTYLTKYTNLDLWQFFIQYVSPGIYLAMMAHTNSQGKTLLAETGKKMCCFKDGLCLLCRTCFTLNALIELKGECWAFLSF